MTNLKCALPVAVCLFAAASPAMADDEEAGAWIPGTFSGSASVTNNYIFRGITQSDDNPAIQGSIGYSLDTGFAGTSVYGGVWGSNVDFNDGDKASVELDWSFGLSGEILDTGVNWQFGAIYYYYPDASVYNYWEVAPAVNYSPLPWLKLLAGVNYSPDYFNGSGEGWYPNGGVNIDIPIPNNWFKLTLEGYTGHQFIEHNNTFGTDDYQDWKLGLSVGVKNITLGAYYTDTSLDKHQCFGGSGDCGARGVVALTASF